jgi:glutathione S-transferase
MIELPLTRHPVASRRRPWGTRLRAIRSAPNAGSGNEPMIRVHHLNNSRSQRVLWLLEELGLDYDITSYRRDPLTNLAPPEMLAVHGLGKLPVIEDGELTLAESGAILEYLLDRYGGGRLVPARGTPEHVRYLYWMHYAEGSAMPALLLKVVFDQIEAARVPFFIRPVTRGIAGRVKQTLVQPQIERHLDYLAGQLGDRPWFAGPEFTAADVQMSFPLEGAAARAGLDHRRPRLLAWLDRIHARPAYQRAIQRGGPYRL